MVSSLVWIRRDGTLTLTKFVSTRWMKSRIVSENTGGNGTRSESPRLRDTFATCSDFDKDTVQDHLRTLEPVFLIGRKCEHPVIGNPLFFCCEGMLYSYIKSMYSSLLVECHQYNII
jgi:hypothetical protein